jgi:hypothetical protein
MTRILMREAKDPFAVRGPVESFRENLIWNNSGNLVFSQALHKLLATPGTTVTSWHPSSSAEAIARANEEQDVVVLPLANAFRLSFEGALKRLTRTIEKLTVPVVVVGVGAQCGISYDSSRLAPMEPTVRRFMAAVLDRSASVGVRGECTADYLRSLGYRDVEVIGCPSMFHHLDRFPEIRRVERIERGSRLALNVSPYLPRMGPVVQHHLERYPDLQYTVQDIETLGLLLFRQPMAATDPTIPTHVDHPLFRENRMRLFLDPRPWYDHLAERDFSFGSRIHGNIASLLAGTPAYVLAHDSRTLELVRHFEIPHRLLRDVDGSTDAAELYDEADYSALLSGHAERWRAFAGFLERNGLRHIGLDGEPSPTFDERAAATAYPPAVDTRTTTSWERARWRWAGGPQKRLRSWAVGVSRRMPGRR